MKITNAPSMLITRRAALSGAAATGALLLLGCSPAGREQDAPAETVADTTAETSTPDPSRGMAMIVYRDPSCGCCESWAEIARQAGYTVDLRDDQDMPGVKRRLGVPEQLASCHTVEVAGLVVEGHVPLDQVARLLRERPRGIRGIAVPGMPAGSPGMEMPDGRTEPFQVIAFTEDGSTSVYRS
jgi:hypothetical protein